MTPPQNPRLTRAHHRLANQIRQARRRRCWNQQDLALQMGVSVSTTRRLERGDTGVALRTLLCGALRLGLLREFCRLLERRPGHQGWRHPACAPASVPDTGLDAPVE